MSWKVSALKISESSQDKLRHYHEVEGRKLHPFGELSYRRINVVSLAAELASTRIAASDR